MCTKPEINRNFIKLVEFFLPRDSLWQNSQFCPRRSIEVDTKKKVVNYTPTPKGGQNLLIKGVILDLKRYKNDPLFVNFDP